MQISRYRSACFTFISTCGLLFRANLVKAKAYILICRYNTVEEKISVFLFLVLDALI